MSRAWPGSLLCVLIVTVACGDRAPIAETPIEITAGEREVELGRAFALTVVRTWRRRESGGEWTDETLAPLRVRNVEISRREDGRRVEETRRYQAYAFSPGALERPVELLVKPVLDPAAPGSVELPDTPEPTSFPWWVLGTAAAGAALILALGRRRAQPPETARPSEPIAHHPGPEVRALARLARLREAEPEGSAQIEAYYLEASGLLRDYIADRFAIATAQKSTEEVLGVLEHRAHVEAVLPHCDLVKFARHNPSRAERESMLESAERFVKETA